MSQAPSFRTGEAAAQASAKLGQYAARLIEELREFGESRGFTIPPFVIRFSHPSRRALPTAKAVAKAWEAYPPKCSDSKVWEVHIHPVNVDPRSVAVNALAGMASVTAGPDVKFGEDYGKVAQGLGLARGKARPDQRSDSWRSAVVDPDSQAAVYAIGDKLGQFPLGALNAALASERKGGDRNYLKALCPTCGPTSVRLSKKALETLRIFCGGSNSKPHEPARLGLAPAPEAGWVPMPEVSKPETEAA